jgi:hypothetical protein
MTPLFSICLPSRDRFDTVVKSIDSVLAQSFRSFELLVADNSVSQKGMIKRWVFESPSRGEVVRVFETERDLSMDENWEFVSRKASGQYVMFLADRWLMRPGTLEMLARIVEEEAPDLFYWPGQKAEDLESALISANAGEPLRCRVAHAHDELRSFLQFEGYRTKSVYGQPIPRALNSGFRRELGIRAREIWPELFRPISPDYTSAVALLLLSEKCVHIEEMMYLPAGNKSNFSDSSIIGLRSYLVNYPDCNAWRGLQLDLVFLTVLNDIESTLASWPAGEAWKLKMNAENALKCMIWELHFKEFNGSLHDTQAMKAAILRFGSTQGLDAGALERVESYYSKNKHRFVGMRKLLRRLGLYDVVRRANNAVRYRKRSNLRSNLQAVPVVAGRDLVFRQAYTQRSLGEVVQGQG